MLVYKFFIREKRGKEYRFRFFGLNSICVVYWVIWEGLWGSFGSFGFRFFLEVGSDSTFCSGIFYRVGERVLGVCDFRRENFGDR